MHEPHTHLTHTPVLPSRSARIHRSHTRTPPIPSQLYLQVYDPETNKWRMGPSMMAHEGGVGVGVIPAEFAS